MGHGSNTFGEIFCWTTFGESHGPAMGVVIDGCPAGVSFDQDLLQRNLAERRPGQSAMVSPRQESDSPQVLSGVYQGVTLGTPIAIIVPNQDTRSKDYDLIQQHPRNGHADDVWLDKFGVRDHRGGGRASARETLNWVIAGSLAQMFLKSQYPDLVVTTDLVSVGPLDGEQLTPSTLQELLQKAQAEGESYGARVSVRVAQAPASLGEPVFYKLKSQLAQAFMGLNAVTGVELGGGFALASQRGSEVHHQKHSADYGGIRGGISTGEDILLQVAFKPTATIRDHARQGRHDPCVALRGMPVLKALSYAVLADQVLMARLNRSTF
jgi:chorismate synthase